MTYKLKTKPLALRREHPGSSTLKQYISSLFSFLVVIFALLDPDPIDQSQCGSGYRYTKLLLCTNKIYLTKGHLTLSELVLFQKWKLLLRIKIFRFRKGQVVRFELPRIDAVWAKLFWYRTCYIWISKAGLLLFQVIRLYLFFLLLWTHWIASLLYRWAIGV